MTTVGVKDYRLLIDGPLTESASGEHMEVINPATGEALVQVPRAGVDDVNRAVAAAHRAFEDGRWSRLMPGARAAALWKLADLIEAHGEELAQLETLNVGKPVKLTRHSEIPVMCEKSSMLLGQTFP